MSDMLKRIDEHLEFHREIDSHKSDVAFLEAVKSHIEDLEIDIALLKTSELLKQRMIKDLTAKLHGTRQHVTEVNQITLTDEEKAKGLVVVTCKCCSNVYKAHELSSATQYSHTPLYGCDKCKGVAVPEVAE